MRAPGIRAIASRARARYASRSPRLEPSAIYAMSNERSLIGGAFHHDFGVLEGPGQGDVRLPNRHANRANPRAVLDGASRHALGNLLEKVDWTHAHDRGRDSVERAIVHDSFAIGGVDGEIDFDRLGI